MRNDALMHREGLKGYKGRTTNDLLEWLCKKHGRQQ